jgi:hypothetical protein
MKWNSNPLDCKRRGSDNATGNVSFTAPMKIKSLEAVVRKDRWQCGVVLFAFVFFFWLVTAPGSAQSKTQKRVTSLQLAGAAQGSRVTIVSDSALTDYEAFRRGDKFYVQIPLAYFSSSLPHFRGEGFEDVQVQKVGGSVIVSFKLEPGATARVDQRSNRLDVTFSAPNRTARRNNVNPVTNRATSEATAGMGPLDNRQTAQGRQRITAGPIPPATVLPYRERTFAGRTNDRQARQAARVQIKPPSPSNKSANKPSATSTPTPDKSVSKPAVNPASTSAGHPAITKAPPASSTTSNPAVSPSGLVDSSRGTSRIGTLLQSFSTHRLVTLLVLLVLLGVILFYTSSPNRRLMSAVKAKRLKAPSFKPTYPKTVRVTEVGGAVPRESRGGNAGSIESLNEYATPLKQSEQSVTPGPLIPDSTLRISAIQENSESRRTVAEQSSSSSVGVDAPEKYVWALAEPTIGASVAGGSQSAQEDQEREVFEL